MKEVSAMRLQNIALSLLFHGETDTPYIIKLSFEFVCFKQNQLLMFFSFVYLDDMRERCCQCGTKTSKQDQQWVRNMSRSRKELIELIRKKFLIWCFSLFNRLDVIYVPDGFTTLVLI